MIPATEDPTGRDLDRFRALFADFGEPVQSILSRLENFDSIHFSPIEEIVLDSSICGRVVLLGDAAHATSPNMAEGASMALKDALVLAQMLARHGSLDEALSAFSERRHTRIRWVQQRTHRRDRIRALPVPLRNLALSLGGTAINNLNLVGVATTKRMAARPSSYLQRKPAAPFALAGPAFAQAGYSSFDQGMYIEIY